MTRIGTGLYGVEAAARRVQRANELLVTTMRLARTSGRTLREIADAAGVSPETVRRMLA